MSVFCYSRAVNPGSPVHCPTSFPGIEAVNRINQAIDQGIAMKTYEALVAATAHIADVDARQAVHYQHLLQARKQQKATEACDPSAVLWYEEIQEMVAAANSQAVDGSKCEWAKCYNVYTCGSCFCVLSSQRSQSPKSIRRVLRWFHIILFLAMFWSFLGCLSSVFSPPTPALLSTLVVPVGWCNGSYIFLGVWYCQCVILPWKNRVKRSGLIL